MDIGITSTTDPRLGQPDAHMLRTRSDDAGRVEAFIPSPCLQNHAANLLPMPNGDLLCTWFGGTQEGIPDISVYLARLPAGSVGWLPPEKLSDDAGRSEQNPILFPAPDGMLWLFWTAQVSGNQDTALVRRRISDDGGQSWGPAETLFDVVGTSGVFVRQPPVVLADGAILLPIWYCHVGPGERWNGSRDTSAVRVSRDGGLSWDEVEVPDSTGAVHMGIEQLADGSLLALYRSRWADSIHESRSADGGCTWSAPVPTALPNNNSSIQFTTLANGHLALVFNDISAADSTDRRASLYDDLEDDGTGRHDPVADAGTRTAIWGVPRAPMTLAVSEDGGRTWPFKRNVEVGDGYCMTNNSKEKLNREFSYPSVKQGPDGAIHVAFTYYRQAIKYVRLSEDWVRGA